MPGIYIHVPFCAAKCGYCAFYSEAGVRREVIDAYLDKLSVSIKVETLSTLYIGGGQPDKRTEELTGKKVLSVYVAR